MSDTRLPIVVVIPTKNEQENIASTVRSVIDEVAAVVVVDSNSTDRTVDIAAELGADVVRYTWDGRYPKKKQWCLNNVRPEISWVLFLDGDETPTPGLLDELRQLFATEPAAGAYDIPLLYHFAGRPLRHGHRVIKRSLVDRTRCAYPDVDDLEAPGMGEQEGHYQPVADVVGTLSHRIEHRDLDPVRTWFDRHNRYSEWESWLETHRVVKASIRTIKSRQGRIFSRVPFKPAMFFAYSYLVKGGFADGRAGLDYAIALSFYHWQIGLKTRERRRANEEHVSAGEGTPVQPLQRVEHGVDGER